MTKTEKETNAGKEKRLANLKPFQPGQSGNPGGRPRKRPITDRYYQRAEEPIPASVLKRFTRRFGKEILKLGATWADALSLRQFIESVVEGHTRAAKEIRESIEGKSPQRLEISGPERKEITLKVVYVDSEK